MSMSIPQMTNTLPTEVVDTILSFVYGEETSPRNQHQKVMTQLNHVWLFTLIRMSRNFPTVSQKGARTKRILHMLKPFVQISRWTGREVYPDDD